MTLQQGLRIAIYGIAAGILAALALTRFLISLLYSVSSYDPMTIALVTSLLLIVVSAATALPAWRAAQINPVRSLRID